MSSGSPLPERTSGLGRSIKQRERRGWARSGSSQAPRPGSDSGQTMGDVLVGAVPPTAVHLCVDMQRFFSSGLPLTVFRSRPEVYSPGASHCRHSRCAALPGSSHTRPSGHPACGEIRLQHIERHRAAYPDERARACCGLSSGTWHLRYFASRVLPSYSNAPLHPCAGPSGRRSA